MAVTESPDTGVWHHRGPQALKYAALQGRAHRFARQLLSLGLTPGDRVIVQLPNVIEHAVSVLGLLCAGFVPCPAPMNWSNDELRAACDAVTAKAIVTTSRYGQLRSAERARNVGAEVFSVRFVCAYGGGVPDGVVSLDGWEETEMSSPAPAPATAPGDVALITFDRRFSGLTPLARTHSQLIADALALSSVARITKSSNLVTTIPAASALGVIASIVVPVLTGASVHLHGPFDSRVLVVQLTALPGAHLLVPSPLEEILGELRGYLPHELGTPVLLHRWPTSKDRAETGRASPMRVVDYHSIGETALFATVRAPGAARRPLPERVEHPAPHVLAADTPLIECLLGPGGQVLVRGFGAPRIFAQAACPREAWRDSGVCGRASGTNSFVIDTPAETATEPKAA